MGANWYHGLPTVGVNASAVFCALGDFVFLWSNDPHEAIAGSNGGAILEQHVRHETRMRSRDGIEYFMGFNDGHDTP